MSDNEVNAYLAAPEPAKREALERLRAAILEILPEAQQCTSYGMPTFKVGGKAVAGFAAFKHHLSYFPHSSTVLSRLADGVAGYTTSKGTLQFPVDAGLPKTLVNKLIVARLREVDRPLRPGEG